MQVVSKLVEVAVFSDWLVLQSGATTFNVLNLNLV